MKSFGTYIGLSVLLAAALMNQAAAAQQNSRFKERVKDIDKRLAGPLNGEDLELSAYLMLFAYGTSIDYVITPEASRKIISVSMENPTLREFLDEALPGTGLRYSIAESGILVIGSPSSLSPPAFKPAHFWHWAMTLMALGCSFALCIWFLRHIGQPDSAIHALDNDHTPN